MISPGRTLNGVAPDRPSYQLPAMLTDCTALRDEHGRLYRPDELPCTLSPYAWDSDAPIRVQENAALLCRECPALLACQQRRYELGTTATGVWGGQIIPSLRTDKRAHSKRRNLPSLPPDPQRIV